MTATLTEHRLPTPSLAEPDASIAMLCAEPGTALSQLEPPQLEMIERYRQANGALLLRGFALDGSAEFSRFCASFGYPLLSYSFGSTPRSRVDSGIYTSTEYPAHRAIALHNEQAYTRAWPLRLTFYCHRPADQGGATPIADSHQIYRALDPHITRSFTERELLYVRNYGNGLDLPWQQVFGTEDRAEVEAFCQAQSIELQWLNGNGLRTRQRCPGIMLHPITGAPLWFNQAHLFHVSALEPEMREVLIDSVGEEYLPRNTYFGDGSTIPDAMLDEIRAVLNAHSRVFEWQQGDLLLLDNMRYAHARQPFSGRREILVAMAEEYRL